MLGNVKNEIHCTFHAIRPKQLPRYLAELSLQPPLRSGKYGVWCSASLSPLRVGQPCPPRSPSWPRFFGNQVTVCGKQVVQNCRNCKVTQKKGKVVKFSNGIFRAGPGNLDRGISDTGRPNVDLTRHANFAPVAQVACHSLKL